jgi:hypothetical protein
MDSVIVKNPKILGGTAVFRGTRVPLQLLFDSLERGHTLEEFLEGYPTVSREKWLLPRSKKRNNSCRQRLECGFCSMSV